MAAGRLAVFIFSIYQCVLFWVISDQPNIYLVQLNWIRLDSFSDEIEDVSLGPPLPLDALIDSIIGPFFFFDFPEIKLMAAKLIHQL